jgi:hypothetical protein
LDRKVGFVIPSPVTFIDQNLDKRDFSNQCVIGVRFVRCRIRRSNFSGADLSYAIFEDCDLYETKFVGAVLYTCRISGCDATKADFSQALLNGIRLKDTDITHAIFGNQFEIGKNRKWRTPERLAGNVLRINSLVTMELPIGSIEESFDGIFCEDTGHAIQFIDDPDDNEWRKWRRRSEVAKTVERVLVENGYKDRSLDVYFMYRYYNTRADQNGLRRLVRLFFLEWVWGYGIRPLRPVVAWIIVVLIFTAVYGLLPMWNPTAGLSSSGAPQGLLESGTIGWNRLVDFFIFSCQVSSLSIYGDMKPVGAARLIALLQQVMSIVIVGFGVATITRRIGNV